MNLASGSQFEKSGLETPSAILIPGSQYASPLRASGLETPRMTPSDFSWGRFVGDGSSLGRFLSASSRVPVELAAVALAVEEEDEREAAAAREERLGERRWTTSRPSGTSSTVPSRSTDFRESARYRVVSEFGRGTTLCCCGTRV